MRGTCLFRVAGCGGFKIQAFGDSRALLTLSLKPNLTGFVLVARGPCECMVYEDSITAPRGLGRVLGFRTIV